VQRVAGRTGLYVRNWAVEIGHLLRKFVRVPGIIAIQKSDVPAGRGCNPLIARDGGTAILRMPVELHVEE
jgi:hypothetical protein